MTLTQAETLSSACTASQAPPASGPVKYAVDQGALTVLLSPLEPGPQETVTQAARAREGPALSNHLKARWEERRGQEGTRTQCQACSCCVRRALL